MPEYAGKPFRSHFPVFIGTPVTFAIVLLRGVSYFRKSVTATADLALPGVCTVRKKVPG